jgi:hypothetical protein
VLYIDPFSTVNYELFFLLKSKDQETSLIVTWKAMDLTFNDQHRMIELSKFHFVRDTIDDIMLVPVIMERPYQSKITSYLANNHSSYLICPKAIIQETLLKLYANFDEEEDSEDPTSYVRIACGSPLVTKKVDAYFVIRTKTQKCVIAIFILSTISK